MAQRKPENESWEGFVEQQIEAAQEAGAFDNLPGAGKPIAGLHETVGEDWWLKRKLKEEQLQILPPLLEARRDIDQTRRRIRSYRNPDFVRRLLEQLNERVLEAIRSPLPSPGVIVLPVNIEEELQAWREEIAHADHSDVDDR